MTELRVKRVIIENVWEFTSWGPVDHRSGKPVASRKGEYFDAWIDTIKRLGFQLEWRKLNAADYGDATTRSRFILMGRSDGKKLEWPVPTHRKRDDVAGDLFSGSKPWRPAREVIDWDIEGRSIFDREKALAPKTLARIYAGARKFGWPEPYLVILRNHMAAQGMDMPLPAITAGGQHIGLAQPIILNRHGDGYGASRAHSIDEPTPTANCDGGGYLVEPFVLSAAHGVDAAEVDPHSRRCKSVEEPIGTVHAGGGNFGVVSPFVLSQAFGGAPRAAAEPLPTIVGGGKGGSGTALISPYYGSGSGETCTDAETPLPTVTSKGRFGMVVPVSAPTLSPENVRHRVPRSARWRHQTSRSPTSGSWEGT